MTIIDLESKLSAGVEAEILAIEKGRREVETKLTHASTVEAFCSSFIDTVYGKEFVACVSSLAGKKKLKILDIGFGRGESSLYLRQQGHTVCALEPSPLNCSILSQTSKKFCLPIQIFQGSAEDIERLPEKEFDLCIFNSSLHHCDQPIQALRSCKHILRHGGRVVAVNEPLLKFYRSKKWYFNQLMTQPVACGHYGGNEHIYYYREYMGLFKEAGFKEVRGSLHCRHQFPRETICYDLQKRVENAYVVSDLKILCKYTILLVLKSLLKKKRGPFQGIFKQLSLVPTSFEAVKW